VQKPRIVAITAVEVDTIKLFSAASQTSGSFRILTYHSVEKLPRGMVGNLCELNEKIMLKMIGANIKVKMRPT
jgi:hypothetical protein